jgi:hypothetical protein
LNLEENISLFEMIDSSKGKLLYRASKDGFTAKAFHSLCDGKKNTITIIKNNLNYVFGGYTSAAWLNNANFGHDNNAFIFSLRKNGVTNVRKFMVKNPEFAIYGTENTGPTFGCERCDIYICDESNNKTGSQTDFGSAYELPEGYTFQSENTRSFLGGNYNQWLSTEIEVYQIFP